jgi:hypothetical protein
MPVVDHIVRRDPPAKRIDQETLDHMAELQAHSNGYALVVMRITDEIRRYLTELELPNEQAHTNFIRGKIAGLRIALKIPEILQTEAQNQNAK